MISWRWAALVLTIVAFIIVWFVFDLQQYISLSFFQQQAHYFGLFVARHYFGSLCVYALLCVGIVSLSLPMIGPFTLLGGYLFGTLPTLLVTSISVPLGATIAFLSIRYFFAETVAERFADKRAIFVQKMQQYGPSYLLTLNLITVVPFFVISALAALTGVPLKTFVWTSAVGTFPMLAVYAFAGRKFSEITSVRDIFSPSLILAFVLLALLSLIPIMLKRMNKVSNDL